MERELVLVGGGHSHVEVLRQLAARVLPRTRATLIVDEPLSVYSGMLPGWIAGQYSAEDCVIDLRALAERAGVRFVIGRAVKLYTRDSRIELEDGSQVPYDVAAFDVGSSSRGLDVPGVADHALSVRPIARFTEAIDGVIARARGAQEPFPIVIVGGGAGGVEVACALRQCLNNAENVRITLVDRHATLMRGCSQRLIARVTQLVAERGLGTLLNTGATAASSQTLTLDDGRQIPCAALLWMAGALGHPLFSGSGLPIGDRGFVKIRSTLQVDGHDNLFASGDCATLLERPETPKAGVYAVRQGPVLARNLRAHLSGRALECYRPQRDYLMLLNLGDGQAVGAKWGRVIEGGWVMRLKDHIDRRFVGRYRAS